MKSYLSRKGLPAANSIKYTSCTGLYQSKNILKTLKRHLLYSDIAKRMEVIGIDLVTANVAALLRLSDKHYGPNTGIIRPETFTEYKYKVN